VADRTKDGEKKRVMVRVRREEGERKREKGRGR
jgi:hypothetical protein